MSHQKQREYFTGSLWCMLYECIRRSILPEWLEWRDDQNRVFKCDTQSLMTAPTENQARAEPIFVGPDKKPHPKRQSDNFIGCCGAKVVFQGKTSRLLRVRSIWVPVERHRDFEAETLSWSGVRWSWVTVTVSWCFIFGKEEDHLAVCFLHSVAHILRKTFDEAADETRWVERSLFGNGTCVCSLWPGSAVQWRSIFDFCDAHSLRKIQWRLPPLNTEKWWRRMFNGQQTNRQLCDAVQRAWCPGLMKFQQGRRCERIKKGIDGRKEEGKKGRRRTRRKAKREKTKKKEEAKKSQIHIWN